MSKMRRRDERRRKGHACEEHTARTDFCLSCFPQLFYFELFLFLLIIELIDLDVGIKKTALYSRGEQQEVKGTEKHKGAKQDKESRGKL